ncbi:MAG: hypothetical protein QM493_01880 [Sulfurovum sp.]
MKVIIDLVEDLREAISNQENFRLMAMLLKADKEDEERLIYAGEAHLNSYIINTEKRELLFSIDSSKENLSIKEIIAPLLILPIADMMYEIRICVSEQYFNMEIVGFAKNEEEKKYFLMLKV